MFGVIMEISFFRGPYPAGSFKLTDTLVQMVGREGGLEVSAVIGTDDLEYDDTDHQRAFLRNSRERWDIVQAL
jgi:hypothetical protein